MRLQPKDVGYGVVAPSVQKRSLQCLEQETALISQERADTLKKLLGCIRAVPSQWSSTNHVLQTPSLGQGIYNRREVLLPLVLQRTLFTNLFLSVQAPRYA